MDFLQDDKLPIPGFLDKLMANPKSLAMISCDEMGIKDVTGRLRVLFSYKIHGNFHEINGILWENIMYL